MDQASYPLIINKNNLNDGSNNTYTYRFGQNIDMSNMLLGLASATMNFSWPNISAAQQNNTFYIYHPATGAANDILTITMPDGGYQISDLNDYLRWFLINEGYYIQNNTTNEQTVYAKFQLNPITYEVEFISYPLPTSTPAGYTDGPAISFPSTTRAPQLLISQPNFGKIIGFATGTFPAVQQTVLNTTLSTAIPEVSSVQNVLILVDVINNQYSRNNQTIFSLSPAGAAYGSSINSTPPYISFVPCLGYRDHITIRLCDQNGTPLNILDPNITLRLLLKPLN